MSMSAAGFLSGLTRGIEARQGMDATPGTQRSRGLLDWVGLRKDEAVAGTDRSATPISTPAPGAPRGQQSNAVRGMSLAEAAPQQPGPEAVPASLRASPAPAGRLDPALSSAIDAHGGVNSAYLRRLAMIESGGQPSARNKSGAAGAYQFMPGTAGEYGLRDPHDPEASTRAAVALTDKLRSGLSKTLGRAPTDGEVYLAHQQGGGGAAALLRDPSANVVDALATAYGGDRGRATAAIRQNGGTTDMTAGQFARKWIGKFEGEGQRFASVRRAFEAGRA